MARINHRHAGHWWASTGTTVLSLSLQTTEISTTLLRISLFLSGLNCMRKGPRCFATSLILKGFATPKSRLIIQNKMDPWVDPQEYGSVKKQYLLGVRFFACWMKRKHQLKGSVQSPWRLCETLVFCKIIIVLNLFGGGKNENGK